MNTTISMSRTSTAEKFGIDCIQRLEWKQWQPGFKYRKKLVFHNTTRETRQLRYSIPQTRFFSTDQPELLTLPPNLTAEIFITFKPSAKIGREVYDDVIEVYADIGQFSIPLQALTPKTSLTLPEELDFGIQAVNERKELCTYLTNNDDNPHRFAFQIEGPFTVSPDTGTVESNTSIMLKLTFSPVDACNSVGYLLCLTNCCPTLVMKLTGVSKYPFISLATKSLHYEGVPINRPQCQSVVLKNLSDVATQWQVVPHDSASQKVPVRWSSIFQPDVLEGCLQAESSIQLKINCSPRIPNVYTSGDIVFSTPGGNSVVLVCSANSLDFDPTYTPVITSPVVVAAKPTFQELEQKLLLEAQEAERKEKEVQEMQRLRLEEEQENLKKQTKAKGKDVKEAKQATSKKAKEEDRKKKTEESKNKKEPAVEDRSEDIAFVSPATLSEIDILFPPCLIGDSCSQTLTISNISERPIGFACENPDLDTEITLSPATGTLDPGVSETIKLQFTPSTDTDHVCTFSVLLDSDHDHPLSFTISGAGVCPDILLENQGSLFFKPTCAGISSIRLYSLKNISKIPVYFEFKIPGEFAEEFTASSLCGTLKANEALAMTWEFAPKRIRKYDFKVPVMIVDEERKFGSRFFELHIRAECNHGIITFDPSTINVGQVLVKVPTNKSFMIRNASDSVAEFNLEVLSVSDDQHSAFIADPLSSGIIKFMPSSGRLDPLSFMIIHFTFVPPTPSVYKFTFIAKLTVMKGSRVISRGLRIKYPSQKCLFTADASLPCVQLKDARALYIPLSRTWQQLSIDGINAELRSMLTAFETHIKHEAAKVNELVHSLSTFDFHFGLGALGNRPKLIYVKLVNVGVLDVDFHFKFPEEVAIDMETWADTGQLERQEEAQQDIIDGKLFTITPNKGSIAAGESKIVRFVYQHCLVSKHQLPILLTIRQGKQLIIMLKGETISPLAHVLSNSSSTHDFAAMPLGLPMDEYPVQEFKLVNELAKDVPYDVDLQPISQLQKDELGFPIFRCLNPTGIVPPKSSIPLRWVFHPLSVKEYKFTTTIKSSSALLNSSQYSNQSTPSENGREFRNSTTFTHSLDVTFCGRGFHPVEETSFLKDSLSHSSYPVRQSFPIPGQIATLSADSVDFHLVPKHSISYRTVILRNLKHQTIYFSWKTNDPRIGLYPQNGSLGAEASVSIRVSLSAEGECLLFDTDIRCIVSHYSLVSKGRDRRVSTAMAGAPLQIPHIQASGDSRKPVAIRSGTGPTTLVKLDSAPLDAEYGLQSRDLDMVFLRVKGNIAGDTLIEMLKCFDDSQTVPLTLEEKTPHFAWIHDPRTLFAPNLDVPSEIPTNGSEDFYVFCNDFMKDLLKDVIESREVKAAFKQLRQQYIPFFVHMNQYDSEEGKQELSGGPYSISVQRKLRDHKLLQVEERSKQPPDWPEELPSLVDSLLESTLHNLISEAIEGEFL